jgi:hypothetical protein
MIMASIKAGMIHQVNLDSPDLADRTMSMLRMTVNTMMISLMILIIFVADV